MPRYFCQCWVMVVAGVALALLVQFSRASPVSYKESVPPVLVWDDISGEVMELSPQLLPQSEFVHDSRSWEGHWPHGADRQTDAEFFISEDQAHNAWLRRKTKVTLLEQKRRRLEEERNTAVRQGGAHTRGDELSEHKANQLDATRRLTLRNDTLTLQNKLAFLEGQVAALAHAFSSERLFPEALVTKSESVEGQYMRLVRGPFAHAACNTSAESVSLRPSRFLTKLPIPMVLRSSKLRVGEREIRSIRSHLVWLSKHPSVLSSPQADNSVPTGMAAAHAALMGVSEWARIREMERVLNRTEATLTYSRMAMQRVVSIGAPLLSSANSAVATQLRAVRSAMVNNDESTETQRQELRDLTKQRARLQTLKARLAEAARLKTTGPHEDAFPAEDTFITLLSLIARCRLGATTDLPADVLPKPGFFELLIGGTQGDSMRTVFHAFGRGLLITAAGVWCMSSVQDALLSLMRASIKGSASGSTSAGALSGRKKMHRQYIQLRLVYRGLYQMMAVVKAVLPIVLPLLVMHWRHHHTNIYRDRVAFLLPYQLLGVAAFYVLLMVVSVVLCSLEATAYKYLHGERPVRGGGYKAKKG